jgi:hypothetical protein
MAIENGLSTREAEAVKLNGSQFSANADKLAVENEQLQTANGGNAAPGGSSQLTNAIVNLVNFAVDDAMAEYHNQNRRN